MADTDKPSDSAQDAIPEPEVIAAEDAVGAQERPSEPQLEREQAIVDEPVDESEQPLADADVVAEVSESAAPEDDGAADEDAVPRVKPEIPGADLVPDIVLEGANPLDGEIQYDEDGEPIPPSGDSEDIFSQPIADTAISLAADARYHATGKRKTAVARVILKPGTGVYTVNGRTLDVHFPRTPLQRQIRQALETVGLEDKMDVLASMHGGGISAQAGALRHGISRALVEADPNLRSELKRRGFMTRDARVKERKKAGLKKARKRPQFSKR